MEKLTTSLLRVLTKLLIVVLLIATMGCTTIKSAYEDGWRIGWWNPDGEYSYLDPHYNPTWHLTTGGLKITGRF